MVWALAAVLLLGANAPAPRADVRAVAPSGGLVATTDVSVDGDPASALLDRSAVSVRAKAPTRSVHAAALIRRVDGGPACAPLARAPSLAPPVRSVPLYALHHVYRV